MACDCMTEPVVMRIVMVVFTVVMVAWLVAVYGINPRVEKKLAEKRKKEEWAKNELRD